MTACIGIDIGGTRLKAGLVAEDGAVVREAVAWLEPADRSEAGLIDRLARLVAEVDGGAGVATSVGIGIAGIVNHAHGVVARSPNFPAWRDFAVKARLQAATGLPVHVDNDANCVIAGEALVGAAAGRDVIGLTLGTGVGGGIVLGGRLWRGVDGMAGQLGPVVADPRGPVCGCGGRGCLEMYPSVNGLRLLARAHAVPGVDAEAADVPEQLARAAARGVPEAQACFDGAGEPLGRVLGSLLNIFNVKAVVLAGGVSRTWPYLRPAAERALAAACFPEVAAGVDIVLGTLGERAGVLGAALQHRLS